MYTNPVFVIGLGGIGNAVARLVRQRFLQTLGDIPETILIRSIDTADQVGMANADPLPPELYVRLDGFAANQVVTHLHLFPEIREWWKYEDDVYSYGFLDVGAAARRPLGRLFFFKQFERIFQALNSTFLQPLKRDVQERLVQSGLGEVKRQPTVYIVASIAGGTGAGMFLDAAFLARQVLTSVGYEADTIKIAGILGLPSVIDVATNDPTANEAGNRRVNAYSALCELDALQSGWPTGELSLYYPPPVGKFNPVAPLFDYTYFFSRTTSSGFHFTKQDDLLVRVAHFLYQMTVTDAKERLGQLTINLAEYFSPDQRQVPAGLVATYGSFGVEWLEIPRSHLVREWCEKIGARVAQLVADLNWEQERRRNLDQELSRRTPRELSDVPRALELAGRGANDLEAVPELRGFKDILDSILEAQKLEELRSAVNRADSEIPRIASNVRNSLAQLDEGAWRDWLPVVAAELVSDKEFRLGGARRFLERLAERIGQVKTTTSELARKPVEEIVEACTGGVIFRKKVTNTAPALEWARNRMRESVGRTIEEYLGTRADRIAQWAREHATFIEEVSESVYRGARGLQSQPEGPEIPRENWLVDPESLVQAIEANMESVASETASEVAQVLARELLAMKDLPRRDAKVFEDCFKEATIDAIERSAMSRAARPEDSAARLKHRVTACSPLMHIHATGPELIEILGGERAVAKPIRLILSKIEGDQRDELEAWTRSMAEQEGRPWAYQIHTSEDPLRDDVLHVTFGWPLWLFREVRECGSAFDEAKRQGTKISRFCRNLLEVTRATSHDIKPLSTTESEKLFALAFALQHVGWRPTFSSLEIWFEHEAFGHVQPIEAAPDEIWDRALQGFRMKNLARRYRGVIDARLRTRDERESLVRDLRASVQRLRGEERQTAMPERSWNRQRELISIVAEYMDTLLV